MVPQWFTSLHRLVRLLLRGSSLNEDSINILQSLPQLAELSLIRALNVDRIECQTEMGPETIAEMSKIRELTKADAL
ncbi:hypothetical protein E2562_015922 [Oryza meyeriana var. granulata]|uniref:Uncharacterized protein n=1 Tax=Oryza meyeriana var. granulata TaxID=110450 RepID=A0A6G1CGI7_9ORYZ|nr:hypothetical protein E2562_015922 [Oryza meyeriana var. granulata]